MAKNNITMLEKKLQKVTEAGIKTGIEKKLAQVRERYDITHNIDKVSAILDDLEGLFDQLEAQLKRTKQSKYYTRCILGKFSSFYRLFFPVFSMLNCSKIYFSNTIRVANSLYQDQARRSVGLLSGTKLFVKIIKRRHKII